MIRGIDPGPVETAVVDYDDVNSVVLSAESWPNEGLLFRLRDSRLRRNIVAIELPRSNFRPVSNDFLDMCIWVGRFQEAIEGQADGTRLFMLPYREIAKYITGNASAQERFVRATLKERFGEIGTKKAPGPMWMMKGLGEHVWSALAVAVVAAGRLQ